MIAGPLYAYQAQQRLKRLDTLRPGAPLSVKTLGVRTQIDPPAPSQKKGLILVGVLLAAVILAIAVMIMRSA